MRILVLCSVIALSTRSGRADEATLTLPAVIAVAIHDSPELQRATIDLEIARAAALKASGIEDLHVGVAGNYQAAHDQPTNPLQNDNLATVGVSASLSALLFTGGTLAIIGGTAYTQVTPALEGTQFTGYTSSVIVSLNQPLLRGFGPGEVEAPIRQAHQAADAAKLGREAAARTLLVSLTRAYWDVALAWRQLEVRKTSLALAQKQLKFTEGAIRADKVAKSEALAIEQSIATREQDVIAAEQLVWDRSLALRELAGLEIGPNALGVQTEPLPTLQPVALDVKALVDAALAHSAELAALDAMERGARAGVDGADGAARSRLDLAIAGGPVGTATTERQSLTNAIDHTGYALTASLTFDHAIQRRTEIGGLAAARAQLQHAKIDSRAARARVAGFTVRAVQRAQAAMASITLGDQAIALALLNVEAEQHRFELSKSTNFDVLRRLDDLEQARLRQAESVVDCLDARADIAALTGDILERYGIVIH